MVWIACCNSSTPTASPSKRTVFGGKGKLVITALKVCSFLSLYSELISTLLNCGKTSVTLASAILFANFRKSLA